LFLTSIIQQLRRIFSAFQIFTRKGGDVTRSGQARQHLHAVSQLLLLIPGSYLFGTGKNISCVIKTKGYRMTFIPFRNWANWATSHTWRVSVQTIYSNLAKSLTVLMLAAATALLAGLAGCGGGGSPYGNQEQAYDGTWSLNFKGYALPAAAGASTVVCTEDPTSIVISHGFGSTIEGLTCLYAVYPNWQVDVSVTITPDPAASGIGATVQAIETNGALDVTGRCIDRVACQAKGLTMIKCGQTGAGC
jgi:hypothetical protein